MILCPICSNRVNIQRHQVKYVHERCIEPYYREYMAIKAKADAKRLYEAYFYAWVAQGVIIRYPNTSDALTGSADITLGYKKRTRQLNSDSVQ